MEMRNLLFYLGVIFSASQGIGGNKYLSKEAVRANYDEMLENCHKVKAWLHSTTENFIKEVKEETPSLELVAYHLMSKTFTICSKSAKYDAVKNFRRIQKKCLDCISTHQKMLPLIFMKNIDEDDMTKFKMRFKKKIKECKSKAEMMTATVFELYSSNYFKCEVEVEYEYSKNKTSH